MKLKKLSIILCSSAAVIVATNILADNLNQKYNRLLLESRSHQSQFSAKTKAICEEIKRDCQKQMVEGGRLSLNKPVVLYAREGYQYLEKGVLQSGTFFVIKGTLKDYYKVTLSDQDYLLLIKDVKAHSSSSCQDNFLACLQGKSS